MELLKSSLKSVLGGPQPGNQPSGAETVERLVERLTSSTLLDDRRDACRALRALSKNYRIEVGAQGLNALRQVLELDRTDCEIVGYALDTLCNVTSPESFDEEKEKNMSVKVGEQFAEMYIKTADNVVLALSYLDEYDFRVRFPALKFLNNLLASKPKEIQEIVLVSPMGVSKLMDLLGDAREVIRNDALLLLIQLTKGNANIQKIVAFENAFDRLFEVIVNEGSMDGGIVVEDCLMLMLNLLKNNTSNQNFFKEGSYIQRLAAMFAIPPDIENVGWSPQKVANNLSLLYLVRTLVSPSNPGQVVTACQKIMRNSGLLETLCNNIMADGVPADVLSETINTVSEVIRGNLSNQEYFSNLKAPSEPPKSAITVLLMSMINDKQPFMLRCAILYCFECFMYKNEIAQAQVVQTLLPTSNANAGLTTGHLLCSGLFSLDSLSNWYCSVALAHTLIDNVPQKEQLLRVMIATAAGMAPVTLLQQCTSSLQNCTKLQSKIGILMLLCFWLAHCPAAVKVFLNVPGSMAFLTAQTSAAEHDDNGELLQGLCAFLIGICLTFNDGTVSSFSKENLCQLIEKRIGLETFITKLGDVSRHETYSLAVKQPQIRVEQPSDLLLENEFCKLFKVLEGTIIKNLSTQKDVMSGMMEMTMNDHENGVLLQYKDVIREQDKRLQEVTRTLQGVQAEKDALQQAYTELHDRSSKLEDQNNILRAQLSVGVRNDLSHPEYVPEEINERLRLLEEDNAAKAAEIEKINSDKEDLLELLNDYSTKLSMCKERMKQLGLSVEEFESDLSSDEEPDH